jgi:hypothetical protein
MSPGGRVAMQKTAHSVNELAVALLHHAGAATILDRRHSPHNVNFDIKLLIFGRLSGCKCVDSSSLHIYSEMAENRTNSPQNGEKSFLPSRCATSRLTSVSFIWRGELDITSKSGNSGVLPMHFANKICSRESYDSI